jgi:hypothetical protein
VSSNDISKPSGAEDLSGRGYYQNIMKQVKRENTICLRHLSLSEQAFQRDQTEVFTPQKEPAQTKGHRNDWPKIIIKKRKNPEGALVEGT